MLWNPTCCLHNLDDHRYSLISTLDTLSMDTDILPNQRHLKKTLYNHCKICMTLTDTWQTLLTHFWHIWYKHWHTDTLLTHLTQTLTHWHSPLHVTIHHWHIFSHRLCQVQPVIHIRYEVGKYPWHSQSFPSPSKRVGYVIVCSQSQTTIVTLEQRL